MKSAIGAHPMAPGRRTRAATTTWVELRSEVMARISHGIYPNGKLIPTEKELALEFGCARATVNRALTSLAERGVLDRKRRVGTRVALDVDALGNTRHVQSARDIVERSGKRFSFDFLGRTDRAAPRDVQDRLFATAPTDIIETRMLYYADGKLFCTEQRWHDSAALPLLATAMQDGHPATEWLAANVPLSHVEYHVSACTAGATETDAVLGCDPAAPVLQYETCLWVGKDPVSFARYVLQPGVSVPTTLN